MIQIELNDRESLETGIILFLLLLSIYVDFRDNFVSPMCEQKQLIYRAIKNFIYDRLK